MKNTFHTATKHWLAIVFSLAVGLLCIAPGLFARRAISTDYQGIPFLYQANENGYIAMIREVIDGHYLAASPWLFEYKNTVPPVLPTGLYFYALPVLLFGIPLLKFIVFSKFFFPLILFLLVYAFIFKILERGTFGMRQQSSLAGALLVVLGYDLIDYGRLVTIFSGKGSQLMISLWTRPVNPITGAILLFALLNLLWSLLTKDGFRRTIWLPVFTGIVAGLTVGYFFSFGVSLAIVAALIFISVAVRSFGVTKDLIIVLVTSVFVDIPFWIHSVVYSASKAGTALALRNGLFLTHVPILNKFVLFFTVVFLILTAWGYQKKVIGRPLPWSWLMVASLAVGSWIVYTQQFITGRTVWPFHFVQYTIPLVLVSLVIAGHNIAGRVYPKMWNMMMLTVVFISFALSSFFVRSYLAVLPDFRESQKLAPVFSWLNKNAPKDCVVLTDELPDVDRLAGAIPAFTHCNTYSTMTTFYGVPADRIHHNYLTMLRINDVSPDKINHYLQTNPVGIRQNYYRDWNELFALKDPAEQWLHDESEWVAEEYRAFVKKDFVQEIEKYRVDYILAHDGQPLPRTLLEHTHIVVEQGEYKLYSLQ